MGLFRMQREYCVLNLLKFLFFTLKKKGGNTDLALPGVVVARGIFGLHCGMQDLLVLACGV